MEFAGPSITALQNLLHQGDEDDSDEDQLSTAAARLGPGGIGPQKKDNSSKGSESSEKTSKDSKDIWDADSVPEGAEFEDIDDPRPQPEYDIVFKQAVSSEDMFLQMGRKTPSTSSCEDIVIKIKLPEVKYSEVELDVKDTFLDCRTPKHKLGLHLPHPVDSKNGRAQWDADKNLLTVTVRMKREYDFINF